MSSDVHHKGLGQRFLAYSKVDFILFCICVVTSFNVIFMICHQVFFYNMNIKHIFQCFKRASKKLLKMRKLILYKHFHLQVSLSHYVCVSLSISVFLRRSLSFSVNHCQSLSYLSMYITLFSPCFFLLIKDEPTQRVVKIQI